MDANATGIDEEVNPQQSTINRQTILGRCTARTGHDLDHIYHTDH